MKLPEDLVYHHPTKVIRDVLGYIKRESARKFLHSPDPESRSLRDRFIACLFAFGLRKRFNREWFIKFKVGDPPDFDLTTLTRRRVKNKPFDHVIGELVTIPNIKDNGDYLNLSYEVVKGKLSPEKAYEKQTMLLIFINSKHGPEISSKLKVFLASQKKYPMIWSICFLSANEKDGFIYNIEQLYPTSPDLLTKVILKEEVKKKIRVSKEMKKYLPKRT